MTDLGPEYRANSYTQAQRDAMAAKGQAMAGGKYPILNAEDLASAISLVGAGTAATSDVKAFIIKRATALGLTAKLPDDWTSSRSRKPRHSAAPRRTEHRSVKDLEVRSADDDAIILTGTPIVYDSPYTVHGASGPFSETVHRSAASHLLNSDVILAWNHDTDAIPLARTGSGTLQLRDGADGLHFEARLDPKNPAAQALESAVSRGDVSQMSIGFTVAQDNWTGTGSTRSRSIGKFGSLVDISPVTWPSSPTTTVSVMQRAMAAQPDETLADIDRIYVELRKVEQRNGKVLSTDNESSLMTALQSVHDVLASNGFDAQAFFGDDDSVEDDTDQSEDAEADEDEDSGEDRSDALELELELLTMRSAHVRA
jgi:HK97 family phage prohead protease